MSATERTQIRAQVVEDLAEAGVAGIKALAPADKSWMAAFVIIFMTLVLANGYNGYRNTLYNLQRDDDFKELLLLTENNRAEELRRAQETIKELTARIVSIQPERSALK